MSVYKRSGSDTYSYDFRVRGHRFSGSTDCTKKRDAEAYEERVRKEIVRTEIDTAKPMSFGEASSLFWHEVAQHHADPKEAKRILAWLQNEIGMSTAISIITDATVAKLVAKKRGQTRTAIVAGKRMKIHLSAATVNRSMTEPLRNILRRAEQVWGQKVSRIEWGKHRMKEPQERVREASYDEEAFLLAAMPDGYRDAVAFAMMTGCRRAEIVGLTWTDINFFAREFRVTGKGDRSRTIPMTDEVYALLWKLRGRHESAVFTFEAKRTRDDRVKGQRYPITVAGLETAWNRHVRRKITDFRFHDTRHTAATRLVRATGSIKMAQHLLGHTDIATTSRYAHVTHDDLRNGLEAAARAKSPTGNATTNNAVRAKEL